MGVIRLRPAEREPPACARYDDAEEVRRFERAMRAHRAYTEPFRLERADDRVDATWFVRSASGGEYAVDVVDGDRHDACTCPDFLANGLGTCKHVEAVRRAIRTRPSLRRALARLGGEPSEPTLAVDATGVPALVLLGRWSARALRALGLERATPTSELVVDRPEAVTPGLQRGGVRVLHAAARVAHAVHRRAALARRKREVLAAVARGRLGLDVLSRPLFPYQHEGVRHLLSAGRAMLADDMGLGKTVQAIAACELMRLRGEASRVLVVTSASLKDQWAREIARYAGVPAVVVSGGAASRQQALDSDAPYKILNYELTWRELGALQRLDADVLILDEAQRAKNFRTKTAATLRAIPSRYLFVLTGTPIENRLDDLYALLQLVDPAVLGPLWRFNLRFHQQGARGRVEGYKNLAALREVIAPVVLRRRKEEVLAQLPPLTEQTRYIALTTEQAELEAGYRADAAKLASVAERRALTREEQERLMALLTKARQACNALELCDPRRRERHSPKLDEFESLVAEIAAQGTSKVLVFSEWTGMLKLAARRLEGLGVPYVTLHGAIPTDRRPALLQRFREDSEIRVLLSTDAGGTGLNLQAASYVIHLDLPWNPGRLDQRTARAHRLGQTRGVSVTYLCAETGIERGIEGTLAGKRAVRAAALDATSDVDTLQAPSFASFVRALRGVLVATDAPHTASLDDTTPAPDAVDPRDAPAPPETPTAHDTPPTEPAAAPPGDAPAAPPGDAPTTETAPAAVPSPEAPLAPPRGSPRAGNRLRLAHVVLEAGFPSDAVRAAYEALGAAIAALLDAPPPPGHAALVAAIYRELVPGGRLPPAAHAPLARLHDLASLDAQGIEVDVAMAREAVAEAARWVERLAGPS